MTIHLRQPGLGGDYELPLSAAPVVAADSVYRGLLKRLLDVSVVLLLAIPSLIIIGFLAVLVARDGSNPFYRQVRLGKDGEQFGMWKLRSMVPNADALLEAHLTENEDARAEWNRHQKLRHDPRITKIGAIIRKCSLDELPQLWNVMKGDMSLVGPRPMMISQDELYPGVAYYEMRPGITGYWQTSVRNEASFAERAHFDTAYYTDMSFRTDLRVLLRTVDVVLRGTGR